MLDVHWETTDVNMIWAWNRGSFCLSSVQRVYVRSDRLKICWWNPSHSLQISVAVVMENVVYFPETPFFPGGNWSKWGVAMQPICRFLEAGEGDSVHAKRPQFSIQTNDKLPIGVRVSRRGPMSCSVEFKFDDFFHFSVVDTLCCLPFYWCSEKGYCHGSSWSLFLPLTLVQVGKCYPCCQGSDIIGLYLNWRGPGYQGREAGVEFDHIRKTLNDEWGLNNRETVYKIPPVS